LFEIGTGSLLSSDELKNGKIPRISAKSDNNGVIGYFDTTDLQKARHFENFISVNFFGADGGIFYHPYKASVEMKVHTLKIPNISFNVKTGNFIATALKLALGGFGYGVQLSSSKLKNLDFNIKLPITAKGGIDYDFMEEFIEELEAYHIEELEAYLLATGLKDYQLTKKEQKALHDFNHHDMGGGVNEFKLEQLFEIRRGNISNQKALISDKSGIYFIAQNNIDNGFVDIVKPQNHKQFKGRSLIIGRQTAVVYYQNEDFITTDGVLVLTDKNEFIKNRNIGLFLANVINKYMFPFGYSNTVSKEKLDKIKIFLPTTSTGEINYQFMEVFISAISKLVIKDVVLYADHKIKATKAVISRH